MGCGPIYASRKALEKGGFTVADEAAHENEPRLAVPSWSREGSTVKHPNR